MKSYKFDTHVHTSETSPCGKVRGKEVARLYKRKAGYHGIVITDHYYEGFFNSIKEPLWEDKINAYLKGYRQVYKEGSRLGLKVLLGMELRFADNPNDYLVYGIDEDFLMQNRELYNYTLKSFRTLINGKDILIYQAHPFRPGITPAEPSLIDGVEVYNGNPRHNSNNDLAYDFAAKNNLKMLSGSDFHQVQDLAAGGIIISEDISTSHELVQLLGSGSDIELVSAIDLSNHVGHSPGYCKT